MYSRVCGCLMAGLLMTAGAQAQPRSTWAGGALPYRQQPAERDRSPALDAYERFVEGRLFIEPAVRLFVLRHTRRPPDPQRQETFVGFINELNEVDQVALRFSVGYRLNDYLSAIVSHENVGARTMNFNNNLSDGNVHLSGPIIWLNARYPVTERFSPHIGVGYAVMRARFQHDAWWTWGWSSPEAYDNAGRPKASPTGRRRFIDVQDDTGLALSVGLLFNAHERLSVNATVQRVDLSTRANAYGSVNGVREAGRHGQFPMSYTAYAVGVVWTF